MDKVMNFAGRVAIWSMVTVHTTVCLAAAWKIAGWATHG